MKGLPDSYFYLRFSSPEFEPTFMHPIPGQWNSSVVRLDRASVFTHLHRGTDPKWRRGQHTHTLLHSWLFKVPTTIKVEVMIFSEGDDYLALEKAGKKKIAPIEWDPEANPSIVQDKPVASFELKMDKEEKMSVRLVKGVTN